MDVVVRVGTTNEGPELILILVEVEYDRRADFLAEMFDRFTLLQHCLRDLNRVEKAGGFNPCWACKLDPGTRRFQTTHAAPNPP